jgi:hypothetical protein
MAGGAAIGFFSHLVLDEIYSVEWSGVHVRLNKFAGSAVKFFGSRLVPNVVTYSLLMLLTYAALMQANMVQSPSRSLLGPPLQRATADEPDFH